jgi:hypothetical protein
VQAGSRPNTDFHKLFAQFIHQVRPFWRDKLLSDVIRERIRSQFWLDLRLSDVPALVVRNNLKWLSFGHLNVLRVEVMQLLEESFKILNSDDIKRLFGADNA